MPADGEAEITELYKLGMFKSGTPDRLEMRRCVAGALGDDSTESLVVGGMTIEPVLERCSSGGTGRCEPLAESGKEDGADGAEPTCRSSESV